MKFLADLDNHALLAPASVRVLSHDRHDGLCTRAIVRLRGPLAIHRTASTELYLFKADSGTSSACSGACATAWPPLLATATPTAGTGLTASKLGTITRSDGKQQVTYNGHPLYLFVKDTKPGDTNGQGVTAFGAAWFALTSSGNQASAPASSSGGGASSGGGY